MFHLWEKLHSKKKWQGRDDDLLLQMCWPEERSQEKEEMNSDLSKCKIGDWIRTIREELVKVLRVYDDTYRIETVLPYYTDDGKAHKDDKTIMYGRCIGCELDGHGVQVWRHG